MWNWNNYRNFTFNSLPFGCPRCLWRSTSAILVSLKSKVGRSQQKRHSATITRRRRNVNDEKRRWPKSRTRLKTMKRQPRRLRKLAGWWTLCFCMHSIIRFWLSLCFWDVITFDMNFFFSCWAVSRMLEREIPSKLGLFEKVFLYLIMWIKM